MTNDDKVMAQAEVINREMRAMSDLLLGAVHTLIGEGWTDEQARAIVVATFTAQVRR